MALSRAKVERIVVPTDYSSCADQALDWAALHAHTFGAKLTVLHVVERHLHFAPGGFAEGPHKGDIEKQRAQLDAYVADRLAAKKVDVDALVEVGEPPLKIREVA